jgi:hypothetical protein
VHHRLIVGVGCLFVAQHAPEPFLVVELGVIGRQIMNAQVCVFNKKLIYSGSFMPRSIVHPKINDHAFEAGYNPGERFQEAVSISTHPLHDTMETVDRIDPAKKIKTFMVLALGEI